MKTAVFTIISNNYTASARTLLQSLRRHEPGWERYVLVVDSPHNALLIPETEATLLYATDLPLPEREDFFIRYNILEANTAVKPWGFSHLFSLGYDAVIYYDPDIKLFSPQVELKEILIGADAVLTPHITRGYEDGHKPDDLTINRAGVYNLGFAALRNTASTHAVLAWWQKHLAYNCRIALDEGVFVDQTWMNFGPSLFEHCNILRHPGYNMAYWNLHYRWLTQDSCETESPVLEDGSPLRFFHYSGFDFRKPEALSKHQNRFPTGALPGWLSPFLRRYAGDLTANGALTLSKIPYRLGMTFDNSDALPNYLREWLEKQSMFRSLFQQKTVPENLFNELRDYLFLPDPTFPQLPLFLGRLAVARPDVKRYFELQTGLFGWKMSAWVQEKGRGEVGLSEQWPTAGWWTDLPAWRIKTENQWLQKLQTFTGKPKNFLHHAAYFIGHHVLPRPLYPHTRAQLSVDEKPRLNVYGYFNAETGVGESARATVRALVKLGYPHRLVNYEVGLLSKRRSQGLPFSLPDPKAHVDLLHVNADQIPVLFNHHPELQACRKYRVAYWAWELEEPPLGLASTAREMDEIWCLSEFNAATFRRVLRCPVRVAPPSVELEDSLPGSPGQPLTNPCTFLSFADFLSYPERKNPFKTLLAYLTAFPEKNEDTRLFLKLGHVEHRPDYLELLRKTAAGRDDVVLWTESLSRAEINHLLQTCAAYVSMHCSEGFGLPIAEALAWGRRAIATGYGGNLQFCTPQNSHLIPYARVAIPHDMGPYRAGQIWADANHTEAAVAMTGIYKDWKSGKKGQTPVDINGASLEAYRQALLDLAQRISN